MELQSWTNELTNYSKANGWRVYPRGALPEWDITTTSGTFSLSLLLDKNTIICTCFCGFSPKNQREVLRLIEALNPRMWIGKLSSNSPGQVELQIAQVVQPGQVPGSEKMLHLLKSTLATGEMIFPLFKLVTEFDTKAEFALETILADAMGVG